MANLNSNKKYHFLYKTTNNINGKYYYGIHSTNKLNDGYLGSGTYLRNSIYKHGKENFSIEILEYFDTRDELLEVKSNIITKEMILDKQCMNLCYGGRSGNINMVVVKDRNGKTFSVFKDDPRYLSGELVSVFKGFINVKDNKGNIFKVFNDDPRYLSGELVGITKGFISFKDKDGNIIYTTHDDPRYLSGELVGLTKGDITVIDKKGNTLKVSVDDPRYLSGELIPFTKGKTTVKDKDGNFLQVSVDDPRYLSGELVGTFTNMNHSDETKRKISYSKKGTGVGKDNSMYGRKRSDDMKEKVSKKLSKKFYVYDMDWNFISEEFGINQFAKKHKLDSSSICKVLNGRIKYTKGYKFSYDKI